MWDILLNLGFFLAGISVGKSSYTQQNNIAEVYNELNKSQDSEYLLHNNWMDAENRAETWKRRYDNLLLNTQTNKDQK
jgi:hypothetical protein